MAEAQLAAEVLVIGVLDPARAQRLVREVVRVLQDEESGHQPRRQTGLAWSCLTDRGKAPIEEAPVDLRRQPRQRMVQIDDLFQPAAAGPFAGRPAVATSSFPTPKTLRPENHDAPENGIPKRKKTEVRPSLPGKTDYSIAMTYPLATARSAFFTGDSLFPGSQRIVETRSANPDAAGIISRLMLRFCALNNKTRDFVGS